MAIKKYKIIDAYNVNLFCDKCGKEMKRDCNSLATYSPKYSYVCECGYTELSEKIYPYQQICCEGDICVEICESIKVSLEAEVTRIMHEIGIPANIKGYKYARYAILMTIEDDEVINAVTKQLYPVIAKKFSSTSSRVERAIRHSIKLAFDRGNPDVLMTYFGNTIHNDKCKPTNSEFIAMIADKIRLTRDTK